MGKSEFEIQYYTEIDPSTFFDISYDGPKKSRKKENRDYPLFSDEIYENAYNMQFTGSQNVLRKGFVPEYMELTTSDNNGIFLGGLGNQPWYIGKPAEGYDGNIAVFGGSGSGKSSSIAKPTLRTWGKPFVAIDIKGELKTSWEKIWYVDRARKIEKRPAKFFEPLSQYGTSSYDPYWFLKEGGDNNLVSNASDLAQAIIPLPHDVRDPFWINSARCILTGGILYYFTLGANFIDTMIEIQSTPISKLIEDINGSKNKSAKLFVSQLTDIEDSKLLSGINTELSNHVMVFATDTYIQDALTPSDDTIIWNDLDTHDIFLCIPEIKLDSWKCVTTLLVTQLIRFLERRPEKYSVDAKEPVLLLLDEFARIGKIDIIPNAISTLRSKNVVFLIMLQSLSQLDAIYGSDMRKIILDNIRYFAILEVTNLESQQYFSNMVGSFKSSLRGLSVNHNYGSRAATSYNLQFSESREPIIYPREFATLNNRILIIFPEGFCYARKIHCR